MTFPDGSSPKPLRRKRGAPLGNANRFKHGIYARPSLPFEIKNPARIPITDLQAEIDTYRDFIHRFGETALRLAFNDLESARRALLTLAYASNQLAALVRTQAHGLLFSSDVQAIEQWVASLPSPDEKIDDP